MDDTNKPEQIHKVAKVHFAKEVTAITVEETDGKVIIPVRKVSVLTTSGQLWEATIGAFISSSDIVTKMYMKKKGHHVQKNEQHTINIDILGKRAIKSPCLKPTRF